MSSEAAKSRRILFFLLFFPFVVIGVSWAVYSYGLKKTPMGQMSLPSDKAPYPIGNPGTVKEKIFGVDVEDPYRWLENGSDPSVRKWVDDQNRLARAFLETTPARSALIKRLKSLFYVDSVSVPVRRGTKLFFTRRKATQEKAMLYCRDEATQKEKTLIDLNKVSAKENFSLGTWSPSRDGSRLAYTLAKNNSDESTLYVLEVDTGKIAEVDVIAGAKYAEPVWDVSGTGFYYVWVPNVPKEKIADRPGMAQVRFHRIGQNPEKDAVIFPATGKPETYLSVDMSWDGRFLFANVHYGSVRNDVYFCGLGAKSTEWKPFVANRNALFSVTEWKNSFYIHTNENASKFRLCKAPIDFPGKWVDIIPEKNDAVLRDIEICADTLVVEWLKNVSSLLEVRDLDGKLMREIALPEIGSVNAIGGRPDQPEFYYLFSSYLRPYEIVKTTPRLPEETKWFTQKLPINPENFLTEQVWFKSKDGTRVPMYIVRGKYSLKDGRMPFVLTGYGGFGISLEPAFSPGIYPWLEAGGGVAIANLRGGSEFGEEWHKQGMGLKKQNVFDDFAAAAQYLVDANYTRPNRLAIKGGSNGGLLVAEMLIKSPRLFRAAICAVPLTDMVRYSLFGGGKLWIPEYGNPEVEADFHNLYNYSPYHHVRAGEKYPAVLIASAADDDRVDPLHARKFAAALQAANKSSDPILLRTEEESGHSGGDKIQKNVETAADTMSFLMNFLGVKPAKNH